MTSFEKLMQFIVEWKISQTNIATKIGMKEKCFNNKLRGRGEFKWQLEEKQRLTKLFEQMYDQLGEIILPEIISETTEQYEKYMEKEKPKRTVFVTTKLKKLQTV